jgi:hypothetical protein
MANNLERQGRAELLMFQSGGFVAETGLVVFRECKYNLIGSPLGGDHRAGAKLGRML